MCLYCIRAVEHDPKASGQISAFSLQLEGQHNVTFHPWLALILIVGNIWAATATLTVTGSDNYSLIVAGSKIDLLSVSSLVQPPCAVQFDHQRLEALL